MVIEALKQVFDHDAQARDEQMSPEGAWPTTKPIVAPLWLSSKVARHAV